MKNGIGSTPDAPNSFITPKVFHRRSFPSGRAREPSCGPKVSEPASRALFATAWMSVVRAAQVMSRGSARFRTSIRNL